MPDPVQCAARVLGHRVEAEIGEHAVEDAPVQDVEDDPFAALHDLGHRRLVAGAPRARELGAVDAEAEALDLAPDRAVPVDDGAEHVEGNHANVVARSGHSPCPCCMSRSSMNSISATITAFGGTRPGMPRSP